MVTQKIIRSIIALFILLPLALYPQFEANPFGGGSKEPGIETEIHYDKGLVLFHFSLDANFHITDLKNGFFKIELENNDFLEIGGTQFPEGIPYADEKVFKGSFDVKVYVKSLEEVSAPVPLKFSVSYQVCQEKPEELCYPP